MLDFIEKLSISKLVISLAIVVAALVLLRVIRKLSERYSKRPNAINMKTSSGSSMQSVMTGLVRAAVVALALLLILEINGIDVSAMVTGLGVAGIIVGLALQDILKDVIMGAHILSDDYFQVGDVIRYGEIEGRVTSFNLRATKIRNVYNGAEYTISNRNISEIEKTSRMNDLTIQLPYGEDHNRIHGILRRVQMQAADFEGMEKCLYLGTQEFGESAVLYLIRFYCAQEDRYDLRRRILALVQDELQKEGISVPFNQLDVHLDQILH